MSLFCLVQHDCSKSQLTPEPEVHARLFREVLNLEIEAICKSLSLKVLAIYSAVITLTIAAMSETQAMSSTTPPRRRSRSRSKGRSSLQAKPIRVWCAGSFDTLHFGHMSFLRKVKQDMMARFPKVEVVVGLYKDQDLIANGQQPVFSLDERYEMLRANKWVDDVVKGVPFKLSKKILKEYNCDYAFCSSLDDSPKFEDGIEKLKDELLQCGLLQVITVPQHEYSGISSSHIVNRMLLREPRDVNNNTESGRNWAPPKFTFPESISCKEILRFATVNIPKDKDKIVYIDGSFDILHPRHLNLLEKARSLGDFLYVGLHSDETISKYAGCHFPIMQWNERLMALLSCKYVSEVMIDAPRGVHDKLLEEFSINVVVPSPDEYNTGENAELKNSRYQVAMQRGIFHELVLDKPTSDLEDPASLSTMDILSRVHQNWADYSYVMDKSQSDVESDLDKLNLSQNRDDGDVLKFSNNNSIG